MSVLLVLSMFFACIYSADKYLASSTEAWHMKMYKNVNVEEALCEELPMPELIYYGLCKIGLRYSKAFDEHWERPVFAKEISFEEFSPWYYGYGIDGDTVIKIKPSTLETKKRYIE